VSTPVAEAETDKKYLDGPPQIVFNTNLDPANSDRAGMLTSESSETSQPNILNPQSSELQLQSAIRDFVERRKRSRARMREWSSRYPHFNSFAQNRVQETFSVLEAVTASCLDQSIFAASSPPLRRIHAINFGQISQPSDPSSFRMESVSSILASYGAYRTLSNDFGRSDLRGEGEGGEEEPIGAATAA
jgi:hypothetical protein